MRVVLDVVKDKKSAGLLNVEVVPIAIVAQPDGKELSRIKGFVLPKDYLTKLQNIVQRGERSEENAE